MLREIIRFTGAEIWGEAKSTHCLRRAHRVLLSSLMSDSVDGGTLWHESEQSWRCLSACTPPRSLETFSGSTGENSDHYLCLGRRGAGAHTSGEERTLGLVEH